MNRGSTVHVLHYIKICYILFIVISRLNLEVQNSDGMTALWLALQQLDPSYTMTVEEGESAADGESFAAQIISKGADPNNSDIRTGNTLLHRASLEGNESASIFLVRHGANVDRVNEKGEAPIHIAAIKGLHHLTKMLLMNDANPNLSTNRKPVEPPSQPIVVIDAPPSQPSVTHPPDSTYSSAMHSLVSSSSKVPESNPFDDFSSLDQLSALGQQIEKAPSLAGSTNPFGDDSDEEDNSGSVPVTTTSRPQPVGGHAATSNVVQVWTLIHLDYVSVCCWLAINKSQARFVMFFKHTILMYMYEF